ncbi:antirestriction protein [Xenorhabdus sp. 42]|uniref:Antirestriction protein n=2 Tax=Xenorhabdus szentirmaii TaxID=290112 RepID=W1IZ86_9GAMM|nr:antirestriction protein [Xenorhabdus sp. ZM]MBD2822432.1 antirestriction protein [Xenorhabdus sp. 42]MBD2826947.1 antirestriction protein [Xenorhabdus sp. 5]PHM30887.1 antirestriction protein [Xenorhabdus szentirmaii DSM 16338]PHM40368.1 antirestriction protein [Xenorhabdus szentirmaii]
MSNDAFIMLNSLSLSATFPHKTPLERMCLSFLLARTAMQLCDNCQHEQWESRRRSDLLAYMVPMSSEKYTAYPPNSRLPITLSADTFGLAVTIAVFAHLLVIDDQDEDVYRYGELRKYLSQHPEKDLIHQLLAISAFHDEGETSLTRSTHNNHN